MNMLLQHVRTAGAGAVSNVNLFNYGPSSSYCERAATLFPHRISHFHRIVFFLMKRKAVVGMCVRCAAY